MANKELKSCTFICSLTERVPDIAKKKDRVRVQKFRFYRVRARVQKNMDPQLSNPHHPPTHTPPYTPLFWWSVDLEGLYNYIIIYILYTILFFGAGLTRLSYYNMLYMSFMRKEYHINTNGHQDWHSIKIDGSRGDRWWWYNSKDLQEPHPIKREWDRWYRGWFNSKDPLYPRFSLKSNGFFLKIQMEIKYNIVCARDGVVNSITKICRSLLVNQSFTILFWAYSCIQPTHVNIANWCIFVHRFFLDYFSINRCSRTCWDIDRW
jgi:hypothetical protein